MLIRALAIGFLPAERIDDSLMSGSNQERRRTVLKCFTEMIRLTDDEITIEVSLD